jgi:Domain of unknown function (DUF5658)
MDGSITTPQPPDRRQTMDRRGRPLQGVLAGHRMRRRRAGRRASDEYAAGLDWHDAHWLGAALAVLLLSVADAFMTITLMRHGAIEANPLMAGLLAADGPAFAYWKVGLTAFGVLVLTAFARIRLFGLIPVGWLLYLTAAGYMVLLAYEYNMLQRYTGQLVSHWLPVPLQFPT